MHFSHSVAPRAFTNFQALAANGVIWPQAGQQDGAGVMFGVELFRMADMRTLSTDANDCGHLIGQIDLGRGRSAFNVDLTRNAVSSIPQNGVNTAAAAVILSVFPGSDCKMMRHLAPVHHRVAVHCSFRLSVIHAREIPECPRDCSL